MKIGLCSLLASVFAVACFSAGKAQIMSTYAGTITHGYSGDYGPAIAAELYHPKGAASDDTGNVYIADADNNVVRKVSPSGIITTVAGLPAGGFGGDGSAAIYAFLSRPNSVAVDRRGNLYICDADNQRIRKVNTAGIITTIVGDGTAAYSGDGGAAATAEINYPGSIALDDTGNLYIADEYNNRIRKVDTSGIITTFAGTGASGYSGEGGNANSADIGFPFGVTCDHFGNVYFSLTLGNRVCKVNSSHIITTVAGTGGSGGFSGDGGPATAADFDTPWGVTTDPSGNLYITDNANQRIRKVNKTTGIVTTVAGTSSGFYGDGLPATVAKLQDPAGVYVDDGGRMFIADYNNHRLRMVSTPFTHAPLFVNGHSQTFAVCENATAVSIDTLLKISDADTGQYETWSVVQPPAHGTLAGSYYAVSSGAVLMPTGLTYTPVTGYVGSDVFKVRIWDGTAADTTTVNINVSPCSSMGVPGVAESATEIFPNPNDGTFALNMHSFVNETIRVRVYNVLGKEVYAAAGKTNTALQIRLDQLAGVYIVEVRSGKSTLRRKITVGE